MSLDKLFADDIGNESDGYNFIDFSQLIVSTIMHTYEPHDTIDLNLTRHLVLNSLRFNVLKNKQKYPDIVICVDNGEGGYWRRHAAWYYKKHRTEQREESGWDWPSIYSHMRTVISELKENFPYIVIDCPHTEADDIIGVLVKHVSKQQPGVPILITSADGDFTQLHKYKNVKQWSPIQKKWVTPKNGSPKKDLLIKIVKGDAKDTISNIFMPSDFIMTKQEGERQKSVSAKLMEQVFNAEDPRTLFTPEQVLRYNENQMLVDFDFIPDHISNNIINEYNGYKPAPRRLIYPYFIKNGMVKLTGSVSEF